MTMAYCERCKRNLPATAFGIKKSPDGDRLKKQCEACCDADRNRPRKLTKRARQYHRLKAKREARKAKSPKSRPAKRTMPPNGKGMHYADRDATLKNLGFNSYAEYLASPHWRAIRDQVFAAKGNQCSICSDVATQIHHTRYQADDLAGRGLDHLHPICRICHEAVEFDNRGNKMCMVDAVEKFMKLKK